MTNTTPNPQAVFTGGERVLFNGLATAGGLFLVMLAIPFFVGTSSGNALADAQVEQVPVVLSEFTIQPTSFAFQAGDRVRFEIENRGQVVHEFRLTSRASADAHAEGGHAGHDDSAGGTDEHGDVWLLVDPGQTEFLEVAFDEHSVFDLAACLLPGHYEAGMTRPLSIAGVMAHEDTGHDHAADDGADGHAHEAGDDHAADDGGDGHAHEAGDDHAADDGGEGDDVSMIEADREVLIFMDEFEFDPDSIQVERGETVRFTVINAGELPHEFRFTTEHAALEHVALDDPGHHPDAGDLVLALDPGAAGMLVVAFDDDAAFDTLACFLDDHYQQGLSAPLMITP